MTEPGTSGIGFEGLRAAAVIKGWPLDVASGSAAAFHRRDLPDPPTRALCWFSVTTPTVVLGSTQPDSTVDQAATAAAGVQVARRRSGGGAVWLAPGVATWVDIIVPAGDPLWNDDVVRAASWVGSAWSQALGAVGVDGTTVHRGGLVRRPWSDLVCFAGLGPGEVEVRGAKVVGISQRRTRLGARFQCAVLHRWEPVPLLTAVALSPRERATAAADLATVARGIGAVPPIELIAALIEAFPTA